MIETAKKLVIFDSNGVLVASKMGGFKGILFSLGREKEVKQLNEEYQKRKLVSPWGLEKLVSLYRGFAKSRLEELALEHCKDNLTPGAEDTVREIKNKGYVVGSLSSEPQFLMNVLKKILGLDFALGTELEFNKEGKATGRMLRRIDRYGKAELLRNKIKNLGLNREDVTVVGHSITDLPMAALSGRFIAFQPRNEVREKADIIIDEENLREVLKYF